MNIKISLLKEHPKNKEFFDEMSREALEDLKKSIEEQGVLHPLVITEDYKVISGHQRLRALKELGKSNAEVIVKHFDGEEQEINALIDANIQSRQGLSGLSPIKIFNIMEFKKGYYNMNHGGNRKEQDFPGNLEKPKTMEDLAKEFGMTIGQLRNISQIKKLTPEFQELIENGSISFGTLKGTVTKLPHQEQQELLNTLGVDKIVESNRKELERLTNKLRDEQNKPPKIIEKVKEVQVIPSDYEDVKAKSKGLENKIKTITEQLMEKEKELTMVEKQKMDKEQEIEAYARLKKDIENLAKAKENFMQELDDIGIVSRMVANAEMYIEKELAPLKYAGSLKRMKNNEVAKKRVNELLDMVQTWVTDIEKMINGGVLND